MLALQDQWIWDFWLFNQGTPDEPFWHAWFLQADKSLGDENLRHWNVSHGHATSRDLKQWTHLGTSFAPAPGPAWGKPGVRRPVMMAVFPARFRYATAAR